MDGKTARMQRLNRASGGETVMVANPFVEARPNTTTVQMLIRSDPAAALEMIRAAGKVPANYGWDGRPVEYTREGMPR